LIVSVASSLTGAEVERQLRLPATPYHYGDETLPAHFRTPAVTMYDTTPADNQLTDAGATLGRVLFYDTRLSANDSVACATCHEQQYAFADVRRYSVGFEGKEGDRNAMSLVNLRYGRAGFFWDERASTLEEQALLPIHSRIEMGRKPDEVIAALQEDERYDALFREAFGSSDITEKRVAQALAQFVRALVSAGSKFDEGFQITGNCTEEFENFTAVENRGKALFMQHCMSCHTLGQEGEVVLFHMFRSLNNGLDSGTDVTDVGEGDVTLIPSDAGHFKASDLRNVEFTAPYMHDGRIATLEGVIEHYSTGVQLHPALGPVKRFQFSESEKASLIAFLKTLSDPTFLTDPRFTDPWSDSPGGEAPRVTMSVTSGADEISQKLTPADRAQLIAEGQGLPHGEVLAWLRDLDSDRSGTLDATEYRVVAEIGNPTLSGPVRRPPRRNGSPASSDKIESAAAYAAYEHLLSYGDGGRGEVFLDRYLQRYPIPFDKQMAARELLRKVKHNMHQQIVAKNKQLLGELSAAIGADQLRHLQQLILLREVDRRPALKQTAAEVDKCREAIAEFDVDNDGLLDAAETARLAHQLESAPGGFGAARTGFGNMVEFHERVMAYDADKDGAVTLLELPERMAAVVRYGDKDRDGKVTAAEAENHLFDTAFEHFSNRGIYIGGGFENVYAQVARLLPELGLDQPTHQQAVELLRVHNEQIAALAASTVAESYPRYCALIEE
jgi:cytochrome c peroxidase